MAAFLKFAEFLASLWVVVGTIWLLYKGVLYVMAAMTEAGMPRDEKSFSSSLAWTIAIGEILFVAAVLIYLWQDLEVYLR